MVVNGLILRLSGRGLFDRERGWTKTLAILSIRARTFKNGRLMIFFSSQFERSAAFLHIFAGILVHPQKHNLRWRTAQSALTNRPASTPHHYEITDRSSSLPAGAA